MKLRITRDKFAEPFSSRVNYTLYATAVLSDDETKLLNDMGASRFVVLSEPKVTIKDLSTTYQFNSKNIADVAAFESDIVEACYRFSDFFDYLKSFKTQTIIDLENNPNNLS